VPFSVALALFRDLADPQAFLDGPDQNPAILDLSKRVELRPYHEETSAKNDLACRLHVMLTNGKTLAITKTDFEGTTTSPISKHQIEQKFLRLADGLSKERRAELLVRLNNIEDFNITEIFRLDAPNKSHSPERIS
jgi:2-methylcitrate dehydratase PrpD